MKKYILTFIIGVITCSIQQVSAQEVNNTKEEKEFRLPGKLTIGGYGEAVFTREFYSDNVYRYSQPGKYKDDPSHGKFDIPHVVINIGYDFGKGWSMGTEIEFEHGGTGTAYEKEYEESGEWEQEVEKGGEVELEQFWLQKSFSRALNIRVGHIVVPVGGLNNAHEPLNFFTVYRPEGEYTILPSTWHQTGISLWGRLKDWHYEIQFLPGLNAMHFTRDGWIHKGAMTTLEFEVANKYGSMIRIDNYSIKGLRMGISGYYGHSIDNALTRDANGKASQLKGAVAIGTFDFTYNDHNWIVRGNFDYGHVGDAVNIYNLPGRQTKTSPYSKDHVGKNALAYGIEAGYEIFSQINSLASNHKKLYVFGRYEYYDSYIPNLNSQPEYPYTDRSRIVGGLNFYPIPQIAVKGEYSYRILKSQYNNEPSISLGIVYQGFFTR